MGKPTGFLEHTRQLPAKRPVAERIGDYREFVQSWTPETTKEQAARCMNCGVPFCHNGCPLGNIIPEFNDAVYRGDWKEAYEILLQTNNFPEVTGRICPAPCESACVLGINQPAVAIEEIEKHIIETAFSQGWVKPVIRHYHSQKQVAIVGSGPAGLAAAAQLVKAGHRAVVFERDDQPGGLLRYGIPDFKLEKTILDRRLEILKQEGVEFRCGMEIGKDVLLSDLIRDYDAVILAGGSTLPRDLSIPGRELVGIHFAMPFLKQQNKRVASRNPIPENQSESNTLSQEVLATGKRVVVIGGGDTGSDCIGTCHRQGALSVTQFELLPSPPQNRTPGMPWPQYPQIFRVSSSHEEGADRVFSVLTQRFEGDEKGHVRAIRFVELVWQQDAQGRPTTFSPIAGTERDLPCDLVLLAMGFESPDTRTLLSGVESIEVTGKGTIRASETRFQTGHPKVFTAGDMRRGQSLVVWAISEGRECAREVDEFLTGTSKLESKDRGLAEFALA